MEELAKRIDADSMVYYSKSYDKTSNVIEPFMKGCFIGAIARNSYVREGSNVFGVVEDLAKEGYTDCIYIAGKDYFDAGENQSMLERLQRHALKHGMKLDSYCSGERSEISGTAARQAVKDNDYEKFFSLMIDSECGHTTKDVADIWKYMRQLTGEQSN